MVTIILADAAAMKPLLADLHKDPKGPPVAVVEDDIEGTIELLASRNWGRLIVVVPQGSRAARMPIPDYPVADKIMSVNGAPEGLRVAVLR
jgi:hypothetical protein